jgi:hypothetical protein
MEIDELVNSTVDREVDSCNPDNGVRDLDDGFYSRSIRVP